MTDHRFGEMRVTNDPVKVTDRLKHQIEQLELESAEKDSVIRDLRDEIDLLRMRFVNLAPAEFSYHFSRYVDAQTVKDLLKWQEDMVEAALLLARPGDTSTSEQRTVCPLCGQGPDTPDEGFAYPVGLRRHLTGYGSLTQCPVIESAYRLGRDHLRANQRKPATVD